MLHFTVTINKLFTVKILIFAQLRIRAKSVNPRISPKIYFFLFIINGISYSRASNNNSSKNLICLVRVSETFFFILYPNLNVWELEYFFLDVLQSVQKMYQSRYARVCVCVLRESPNEEKYFELLGRKSEKEIKK